MAEQSQDGQERTEEPTAKKLQDAREKGQVPRSRELNTFLVMMTAAVSLMWMGGYIVGGLLDILENSFQMPRQRIFDPQMAVLFFKDSLIQGLLILAPFLLVLAIVAIAASLLVGGWNFAPSSLAPKFSKMNPISGLKRVFGPQGLIELLKSLGKFGFLGAVALALLSWKGSALMALGYQSLEPALDNMATLLMWFFVALSFTLIVIAIIDVPFQIWNHKRQLRMTMQEVKEERKQTDGSPEVKGRIRQLQVEMAQRRMMEEVPKADVVITNPTHYAVALRYDQNNMNAPRVVAKGQDLVAAKIRDLAEEHGVPLLSSPPLARAIYFSTELNDEIPAGLYKAVAQVLAYIYQINQGTVHARGPLHMEDVDIPDDLRVDE